MAERSATQNPTTLVGTNISGFGINTGQLMYSQGAQKAAAGQWSGTGNLQIHLGAGRLDVAQTLAIGAAAPAAASGVAVIFFDGAVAGAFTPSSGHRLLAVLDPKTAAQKYFGALSYNSGAVMLGTDPIQIGMPFFSGLNVSALSGSPGFACGYTPVVSG